MHRKIVIALLSIVSIFTSPSHAVDLYLDINGMSKHSEDSYIYRGMTRDYNSRNSGLGITADLNKYFEASGGFYDNSYYHQSLYGSVTMKHDLLYRDFSITPGINVGLATGYENTPVNANTLQPFLIAKARITWHGVGLTVGYIPPINLGEGTSLPVITLQMNVLIKK